MVTSTGAKAPTNGKGAPPSANATPAWTPQQDSKLVNYVRANAPHIIAGLLASASRMGEERDWTGMHEYQTMASKLSELCGLKALTAAQAAQAQAATATHAATMAASAGGGAR